MIRRSGVCALRTVVALALGAGVGCGAEQPPADCMARASVPELRVVITGAGPGNTVRIAALAVGTAPRTEGARLDSATGTCVGAGCAAGIALHEFVPDTLVLTIEELGARVRHVAVPHYGLNYPSGPQCGGAVRIGRVTYAAP